MTCPSSRFYKIKNYLPKDLQTFKVPVIQSKFSPIWGLPSIKIFEVMKKIFGLGEVSCVQAGEKFFQPTELGFEFGLHYPDHCTFKEPLGRFEAKWTQKRKIHLHVFCRDNLDSDNIAFHQQLQHMCCEIAPALPSNFARSRISTRQKQLLPPIGQCQYRQK